MNLPSTMAPVTAAEMELLRADPQRLTELLRQVDANGVARPWLDLDSYYASRHIPTSVTNLVTLTPSEEAAFNLKPGPGKEDLPGLPGRAVLVAPDQVRRMADGYAKAASLSNLPQMGGVQAILAQARATMAARLQPLLELVGPAAERGDGLVIWLPNYQEGDLERAEQKTQQLRASTQVMSRKGEWMILFACAVLAAVGVGSAWFAWFMHTQIAPYHHLRNDAEAVVTMGVLIPGMVLGMLVFIAYTRFKLRRFRQSMAQMRAANRSGS